MEEDTIFFGFGTLHSIREEGECERPSRLDGLRSISDAARAAFERSPGPRAKAKRPIGFAIPRRS